MHHFMLNNRTNGTSFFNLGWLVNAMIVRRSSDFLAIDAKKSFQAHSIVKEGIRDWLVLG